MKINDYKVGTTFEITCTKETFENFHNKNGDTYYNNFGIIPRLANMWARKEEDVIKVRGTIIEEDVLVDKLFKDTLYDDKQTDYFGQIEFEDFEETGQYDIRLIYPNIKLYFMCFPYGPDSGRFWKMDCGKHKKGDRKAMTVRLKFEEI